MKSTLIASLMILGLVTPALAAEHYAVKDTENHCSVVDATPSRGSGLRMIGSLQGYDSKTAAENALKNSPHCHA
jgi:hypothetical protein